MRNEKKSYFETAAYFKGMKEEKEGNLRKGFDF